MSNSAGAANDANVNDFVEERLKEGAATLGTNAGAVVEAMRFQNFLIEAGIVKKASYRIDGPFERRAENTGHVKHRKTVTRVF